MRYFVILLALLISSSLAAAPKKSPSNDDILKEDLLKDISKLTEEKIKVGFIETDDLVLKKIQEVCAKNLDYFENSVLSGEVLCRIDEETMEFLRNELIRAGVDPEFFRYTSPANQSEKNETAWLGWGWGWGGWRGWGWGGYGLGWGGYGLGWGGYGLGWGGCGYWGGCGWGVPVYSAPVYQVVHVVPTISYRSWCNVGCWVPRARPGTLCWCSASPGYEGVVSY